MRIATPAQPAPYRATEFVKLVGHLVGAKGNWGTALKAAEAAGESERIVSVLREPGVMQKAGVSVGSTVGWGAALVAYNSMVDGFIDLARTASVFDRVLTGGMLRVPLKTKLRAVTAAATGMVAGEMEPVPVVKSDFAVDTIEPRLASSLMVISDELAKLAAGGGPLFGSLLRAAVVEATDSVFVAELIAGVTPIGSTGFLADLAALLAAVDVAGNSKVFVVYHPDAVKVLATTPVSAGSEELAYPTIGINGGEIAGVTVLSSNQVASGSAVMIVADGLAGNAGSPLFDTATQATVQLDSDPDSPVDASTVVHSLWQHGTVGLRTWREFGFIVARENSIAALSSVSY